MANKKQRGGPDLQVIADEMRAHSIILEDIRAQTSMTIEAVEASRSALERRIDRVDQDSRSRDAVLELSIRDLKVSVRQIGVDVRDVAGKIEALSRLEERVSALERARA